MVCFINRKLIWLSVVGSSLKLCCVNLIRWFVKYGIEFVRGG